MVQATRSEHNCRKYLGAAAIGALVFVAFPETARWLHGGAFAQQPTQGGSTTFDSRNQSGGFAGVQNAQNITNYNGPVTQQAPLSASSALEQSLTNMLADPDLTPEARELLTHKLDLYPIALEYERSKAPWPVSRAEKRSPEAISFYNKRLQELGKTWQVTLENIDFLFGPTISNLKSSGYGTGIKIEGGSGNTFVHTEVSGARTGVDLKDAQDNKFFDTRISNDPLSRQ